MADAKQVGEGYYLVKGTARELADGRIYVVTENGYLEEMREVCLCEDCDFSWNCPDFEIYNNRNGFCMWGRRKEN